MEETKLLEFDLSIASPQLIEILLEDGTESEIFTEIFKSNKNRPEILKLLIESPNVQQEIKEEAVKLMQLPVIPTEKPKASDDERKQHLIQKLQVLTVGEKISLALKGGRDIRTFLTKDSNKEVVMTVLKNPKITVTEIELMAHSRNVTEEALRTISKNREWVKDYNVILALVNNPKTPPGIGASMVANLKTKDIAILEKNKNVSEAVRTIAKKVIHSRKPQ